MGLRSEAEGHKIGIRGLRFRSRRMRKMWLYLSHFISSNFVFGVGFASDRKFIMEIQNSVIH